MKEIIEIQVTAKRGDISRLKTDMLAVGLFAGAKRLERQIADLDKHLGGAISDLIRLGDFKGKEKTAAVLYCKAPAAVKRIVLVGLGEKKKLTLDKIREAAAAAADKAVSLKAKEAVFALHAGSDSAIDMVKAGRAIAEGTYFGGYRYDEFVTGSKDGRNKSLGVEVVDSQATTVRKLGRGIDTGSVIGQCQNFARTIANRPGNVINPPALAKLAKKMAGETPGLSCAVFDEKQLEAKKMGGILAVGAGSASKPRLIVLTYTPKQQGKGKHKTIGLVGKAITFDSGGISIKPANNMQDMKFDKSGGIAVLATMKAIAALKPAVKVYGIIPSAENLPGPTSYRPGDIITTFSGKTVEVQNTDAEGRMILCDGIHYAVSQKCEQIVDIATLTGACMVALGKYKAGLMGNDERLIKRLQAASETSGEKLWHLPSGDEYLEEMKSKIADLKNTGGKWGGACTAASFLSEFAGKAKWAHIDMAGVDIFNDSSSSGAAGASGFGVRLLTNYLMNEAGRKS